MKRSQKKLDRRHRADETRKWVMTVVALLAEIARVIADIAAPPWGS